MEAAKEVKEAESVEAATREVGKVKWFDPQLGYGFLERQDGSQIFVHFSAIQMEGFKTLNDDTAVEFEVKVGPKGKYAEKVVAINGTI